LATTLVATLEVVLPAGFVTLFAAGLALFAFAVGFALTTAAFFALDFTAAFAEGLLAGLAFAAGFAFDAGLLFTTAFDFGATLAAFAWGFAGFALPAFVRATGLAATRAFTAGFAFAVLLTFAAGFDLALTMLQISSAQRTTGIVNLAERCVTTSTRNAV
jgi:hypothetical protein